MQERGPAVEIEIVLQPHGGIRGRCSQCRRPAPGYDRLPERRWQFVPLWGIATWFRYAPRRVQCPEHGVVVEDLPWSDGKRPLTCALMGFLARWARRLSWRETARVFQTSWESVYRSVEWFVEWGLAERQLAGVESMGVDEIHWGHGLRAANFLTVIYQIDGHCRRLLWVGQRRTEATLRRGLKALGPEVVKGLRFVCSDMWKPYLRVLAAEAGQALHVLDRFHITLHLNQAVDQVRRAESARLRAASQAAAQQLKHTRWTLLRRGSRVRGRARQKLQALLASKLQFDQMLAFFPRYVSVHLPVEETADQEFVGNLFRAFPSFKMRNFAPVHFTGAVFLKKGCNLFTSFLTMRRFGLQSIKSATNIRYWSGLPSQKGSVAPRCRCSS